MSVDQMRVALKKSYPSAKWSTRVDGMSERQVGATYRRLLYSGKL